jgi:hypothetical protein
MAFSDIPVRENGQNITYAWFNALRTAGLAVGGWTKYTVLYSDLSTAATTNNITLLTLAIKGKIEGLVVKHSTAFSGGALSSYKIDVGIVGELDRYLSQFDVFQAVSNSAFNSVDLNEIPSFLATTAIKIKATSVGANLSAATAGSVDIWVKTATLP